MCGEAAPPFFHAPLPFSASISSFNAEISDSKPEITSCTDWAVKPSLIPSYPPTPSMYTSPFFITSMAFFCFAVPQSLKYCVPLPMENNVCLSAESPLCDLLDIPNAVSAKFNATVCQQSATELSSMDTQRAPIATQFPDSSPPATHSVPDME